MARGWESKSVEDQMATAAGSFNAVTGVDVTNDQGRRLAAQQRAARQRQMQELNLQRENILSQRTSNPGRRAALEAALADIEAQLQKMN
jgi:hypothetical protein